MMDKVGFSDYFEIQGLAFNWARCYDIKHWDGLQKIMGPAISLDFRELQGALHENLSIKDFTAIIADEKVIGSKVVKTQHLLGASDWNSVNDKKVEVAYQIRAAHQRYSDETLTKVVNKGTGYGVTQLTFEKIDSAWKISGVKPSLWWTEDDLFGTVNPEGGASSAEEKGALSGKEEPRG